MGRKGAGALWNGLFGMSKAGFAPGLVPDPSWALVKLNPLGLDAN